MTWNKEQRKHRRPGSLGNEKRRDEDEAGEGNRAAGISRLLPSGGHSGAEHSCAQQTSSGDTSES